MEYYRNSREHLNDRIELLKWTIIKRIQDLVKKERILPKGRFKKLFTNQAEIVRMTLLELEQGEEPYAKPYGKPNAYYPYDKVLKKIEELRGLIDERVVKTYERGRRLALIELQSMFELAEMEINIILLATAGEIDPRIFTIYHFICAWPAKEVVNSATTELFFRVFADTPDKALDYRKYFSISSPLLVNRLISISDPVKDDRLRYKTYSIPQSVVDFCLDIKCHQLLLYVFVNIVKPTTDRYLQYFTRDVREQVHAAVSRYREYTEHGESAMLFNGGHRNGLMFALKGNSDLGQRYLAESISYALGRPMFSLDVNLMVRYGEYQELIIHLCRDARLFNATIYLHNFDSIEDDKFQFARVSLPYLFKKFDEHAGVIFVSSSKAFVYDDQVPSKVLVKLEMQVPKLDVRSRIWADEMAQYAAGEIDFVKLSRFFGFHIDAVKASVRYGLDKCFAQNADNPLVQEEHLVEGAKAQLNKGLAYMGSRVGSKLTWDDMVLPKETKEVLDEILINAKFRSMVLHDWGFKKRLKIGTGIGILFSGEPGTGKTMAAGIIASTLEKELYKINTSTVMSKWIGETEKQLQKVFDEATESQSILLFDEADSLFSKRTEVATSTDRYSNMMINFLLQKIEEFEGVCILTTNLKKGIDKAFIRRLAYRVNFPFPDEVARSKIWAALVTPEMPLAEEIDYLYLAKKYKIAGGHIKNCLLRACFFALEEGSKVGLFHLDKAAQKECKETGTLWNLNLEAPIHNPVPLDGKNPLKTAVK